MSVWRATAALNGKNNTPVTDSTDWETDPDFIVSIVTCETPIETIVAPVAE